MKAEMLTKTIDKLPLSVRRKSPTILVGIGIVGIVASTVMVCRKSRKAAVILEEHQEKMDNIREEANEAMENGTPYDIRKATAMTYLNTGVALGRTYAPSLIIGTLSIGCVLQSHRILAKRNVALTVAYKTLDEAFKKYRSRVLDELGEAADRRFRYGTKEETIEIVTKDDKGKEKKTKQKVEVIPEDYDGTASPYSRIFDEFSNKWDDDPEYNRMFLEHTQNYANDYLRSNGYVFLNQVYKWLGFPQTEAGQQVGWVYDPKNSEGDCHIDFGIREVYKKAAAGNIVAKTFVNGLEPSVMLDFNVEGPIMHKVFNKKI